MGIPILVRRHLYIEMALRWSRIRHIFIMEIHIPGKILYWDRALVTLTWWLHQMETLSALLALCAGNSLVPDKFPSQRPVTLSFDVFFDLCLNERLSKQLRHRWFGMSSRSLWLHSNAHKNLESHFWHFVSVPSGSRNCGFLVTWFCYQLIAKPGNKTATVPWPDPSIFGLEMWRDISKWVLVMILSSFSVIAQFQCVTVLEDLNIVSVQAV